MKILHLIFFLFCTSTNLISQHAPSCYPYYHNKNPDDIIGKSKNNILNRTEKKGGEIAVVGSAVGAVATATGIGGIILSAIAWPLTITGIGLVAVPKAYRHYKRKPLAKAKKLIRQAYIFSGEQSLPGSKSYTGLRLKGVKRAKGIKKDPLFYQLWDQLNTRDEPTEAKEIYKTERLLAQAIVRADKELLFCQEKENKPGEKNIFSYKKIATMILSGKLETSIQSVSEKKENTNHWERLLKNATF